MESYEQAFAPAKIKYSLFEFKQFFLIVQTVKKMNRKK